MLGVGLTKTLYKTHSTVSDAPFGFCVLVMTINLLIRMWHSGENRDTQHSTPWPIKNNGLF